MAVHGAVGFNVVDDLLGLAVGPAAVGFDVDVVAELLGLALEVDVSLDGLDVALPPLPPTGPNVPLPALAFVSGPLVDLAAVMNVSNSMPSIDIDPSSTPGSDIMERLRAFVTTRTETKRVMTFIV